MRNNKTAELVLTALFAAIIIIMAFTPLGYIPLVVINATIIHIPVILGSLFCGPKKGGFLGFIFGLTSFFKSAFICFVPRILVGILPYFVYIGVKKALSSKHKIVWASVFNIVIGVFLFIGARAFLLHVFDKKPLSNVALYAISALVGWAVFMALEVYTVLKSGAVCAFVYAGVTGAMVNTILVMGGIFVLYKDAYAKALSVDAGAVLGIIGGVISFNGVIEAIVAAIIVAALGMVLNKLKPIRK